MDIVICTTVMRGADTFELSGRIIEFSLSEDKIIKSLSLNADVPILGPRGGSRGGRGVRVFEGNIFVAIYDRVLVYDKTWRLVSEVKNPLVAGHHEIQVDPEGIWCCSTLTDAIFKLDFAGNILFSWWASEDDEFVAWTKSRKMIWDKSIDYTAYRHPSGDDKHPDKQFHINSVYCTDNAVFAYDSNYQALFQVWPQFRPVLRNPHWDHAHNVCPRGVEVLVNVSAQKTFEVWRIPTGIERFWKWRPYRVRRVRIFPGEEKSTQFSRSGWVRGLIDIGNDKFLVGANPASLHLINKGFVERRWCISNNVNETIHGLTVKQ